MCRAKHSRSRLDSWLLWVLGRALGYNGDMSWPRVIVHADMDAFFAAVEELDDPSLVDKPLIIGGTRGRGVVSTCNYAARRYGIHSAMPMVTAQRRCPHAVVRPPRFSRYKEISTIFMETLRGFSDIMQPLSVDEAFLDVTATAARFPGPAELGRAIKDAVRASTQLIVSVGVASSKYVAKVASDHDKPDGLTVVPPEMARAFLAPMPVSKLWGAGPKTVERLHAVGLRTISDIADADPGWLSTALGRSGPHFRRLALAQDEREVITHRSVKSIGYERTLLTDVRGAEAIDLLLVSAADAVAERLAAKDKLAGGVRVKLKSAAFQISTRQVMLDRPTHQAPIILAAARRLLPQFDLSEAVRLVGVTGFDLHTIDEIRQLELPLSPSRGHPGAS
ncbi:MAG: DNA polymerase-4 [Bradymonadia bacterium]|jgi:DNA polymerase-4